MSGVRPYLVLPLSGVICHKARAKTDMDLRTADFLEKDPRAPHALSPGASPRPHTRASPQALSLFVTILSDHFAGTRRGRSPPGCPSPCARTIRCRRPGDQRLPQSSSSVPRWMRRASSFNLASVSGVRRSSIPVECSVFCPARGSGSRPVTSCIPSSWPLRPGSRQ